MTSFYGTGGRGCSHCEVGIPVVKMRSKYGATELCLECALLWFPGRSVTWWESRHAPLADHLGNAIVIAMKRDEERAS